MSFRPTDFRPFARSGWGGRASNHFRGLLVLDSPGRGQVGRGQVGRGQVGRGQVGTVIYRSLGVTANYRITGVTRDSSGVALASCRVELFTTNDDMPKAQVTSDASGNFSFESPGSGPFYIVAYKAGSPDVAGTSVNTLVAS